MSEAGRHLAAAVVAVLGIGCAGHPAPRSPEAPQRAPARFDGALSARARGDLEAAAAGFRDVLSRCSGRPLGDRAFLLLAATELDPRFRSGPPDSAAAVTARGLAGDSVPRWVAAMARSLHLVARDLGGSGDPAAGPSSPGEPSAAECEIPGDSPAGDGIGSGAAPSLPRPSLHERLETLRGTVDSLQVEVERLRDLLKTPPR